MEFLERFFEPTNLPMAHKRIDYVLAICMDEKKNVLFNMAYQPNEELPRITPIQSETITKTATREIFKDSGCVLSKMTQLGVINGPNRITPIFVGLIEEIEYLPSTKLSFISLEEAIKKLHKRIPAKYASIIWNHTFRTIKRLRNA